MPAWMRLGLALAGIYNLAWGAGLMSGPALGGFLFERLGFWRLMLLWAPMLIAVRWRLAAVGQERQERQERREGQEGQEGRERQEGQVGLEGREG